MKIFCHKCLRQTNHTVLVEKKFDTGDENWSAGEEHAFGQCGGCDSLNYAVSVWSEDCWNPVREEMEMAVKTYPRGETERQPFDHAYELPPKVALIYNEVIGSMNAQLPVLSGIGLRALIEAICVDQEITGKLYELIDGLATKGVLSTGQAEILHKLRFLGNAAAHQITSAQPAELSAALQIAESVLHTIYGTANALLSGKDRRRR